MGRFFAEAPSPFLGGPDASRMGRMLDMIASQCGDAELALELFTDAQHVVWAPRPPGRPPPGVEEGRRRAGRLQRIYARSFVFSVDNFMSMAGVLAKDPAAPSVVQSILESFDAAVPGVRDVRNSLHHVEDRVRGLKTGEKSIDIKPVQTDTISDPQGVAMLVDANIEGTSVIATCADGEVKRVEISEATVKHMIDAPQKVIDGFEWIDVGRFPTARYPRY